MNLAQSAWEENRLGRLVALVEQHRPQVGQDDLRGFEWYYWRRLADTALLTLKGHQALVGGVVFSPAGSLPRMTWWDHRGGREWVSYRFDRPRRISESSVYWFDDTGRGQCRVPASWRLLWLDGEDWKPVALAGKQSYATERDGFNRVEFEPVMTRGLRLEVELQPAFSGGILEWQAE